MCTCNVPGHFFQKKASLSNGVCDYIRHNLICSVWYSTEIGGNANNYKQLPGNGAIRTKVPCDQTN